jgi:GDPmannose 4,6-dehydratase
MAIDGSLYRPTEIALGRGEPGKAMVKLGLEAKYRMLGVVRLRMEAMWSKF